ncbi:hypothetical protein [Streptomyces sp. NPDC002599]
MPSRPLFVSPAWAEDLHRQDLLAVLRLAGEVAAGPGHHPVATALDTDTG